jgi:hypothetical protein
MPMVAFDELTGCTEPRACVSVSCRVSVARGRYGSLAMTTFAANCSDEEIRKAVVEWSELLAQGKFASALAMFPHTSESFGFEWQSTSALTLR